MKSLICWCLISISLILLKFIGMVQWAIESLNIKFQVILISKLYHSILLHPCFSITELKFYDIFDFKALNDLTLFIITEGIWKSSHKMYIYVTLQQNFWYTIIE